MLINNPVRAYRNAREAFRIWNTWRRRRKFGKEIIMPGEPALRTSTKAGGTMTVGAIVVSLLGSFFPDVLASMSPEAILLWGGLITGAIGWVTARFSKTAQSPGIL